MTSNAPWADVPRSLDAPPRFLFWDLDYVLVAVCGFGVGLIISNWFWGVGIGALFCWLWMLARAGGGTARAFAVIYWHLPFDIFHRVPASARRHFIG